MSDKIREQISALYDGEVTDFEARRALTEVGKNPTLSDDFERFELIGRAVRNQATSGIDLSAGIMAAIEGEQDVVETAPQKSWATRWYTQAAMAAGVAFSVIFALNPSAPDESVNVAQSEPLFVAPLARNSLAIPASAFGQNPSATAAEPVLSEALRAQIAADINAYMLRHAEQSAAAGGQGLLPLARVMSSELQ